MKQVIFLFFLSCIISEIHALKAADCEGAINYFIIEVD